MAFRPARAITAVLGAVIVIVLATTAVSMKRNTGGDGRTVDQQGSGSMTWTVAAPAPPPV